MIKHVGAINHWLNTSIEQLGQPESTYLEDLDDGSGKGAGISWHNYISLACFHINASECGSLFLGAHNKGNGLYSLFWWKKLKRLLLQRCQGSEANG